MISHVTRDEKLVKLFRGGLDIHKAAYREVFGKPDNYDVTPEERQAGKNKINYPAVYGCGPDKFFALIGHEDMEMYNRLQILYPGIVDFKKFLFAKLHKTKVVESPFGRAWEFPKVNDEAEREGFNYIFQSMGHDILKVFLMAVMDEIDNRLIFVPGNEVLLCNEVHDDFLIDSPPEYVDIVAKIMHKYGDNLNPLIKSSFGIDMLVPILADVKIMEVWKK